MSCVHSVRRLQADRPQFPRYILIAKPSTHGRFSLGALRHVVRSTVLGVMQTLSSIFPETDTLIVNEDQVLRVGVAARV